MNLIGVMAVILRYHFIQFHSTFNSAASMTTFVKLVEVGHTPEIVLVCNVTQIEYHYN